MDEFGIGLGQQFGGGLPMGGMSMTTDQQRLGQPGQAIADPMQDPEFMAAVQALVAQYGMSPEQATQALMEELGQGQQSGVMQQTNMGQPPRLSEADYMALAQQFGITPTGGLPGNDPAYSSDYDIANVLGRAYE